MDREKKPSGYFPEELKIDLSDFPQKSLEKARFKLQVITPLLLTNPENRKKELVAELVKKKAKTSKSLPALAVSVRSVYRWVRDYENSGCDIRSLIPNYAHCGGAGKSRLVSVINNIVDATIKDYSTRRERFTIDDIHRFVTVRINEENVFLTKDQRISIPSRRTISRRITSLDLISKLESKNGKQKTKQMIKQAGKINYPDLPLQRVEIDHTKTDIIVIDEKDNLPLGRLTLTYMIDTATRYPLGYYLGFETPSYLSVMECLYNSILRKQNFKEKYGTEHEWLAYGVPSVLVTDQGKEFIGDSLSDACETLGIILEKAPIRTPEFKATVERGFGTLNTGLFHKIPGTTFSNIFQKGDYNAEKQACITLNELERVLNIFIVDIYAEQKHTGINGIPARRWEYALDNNFIPRLPPDSESLRVFLGQITYRTINQYGIELNRIRYNCQDLSDLRFLLKNNSVKIKFHPGDLSRIYALNPVEKRYIEVPALDQEYTKDLSLWKHRVIMHFAREHSGKMDLSSLGKAAQQIQEIVDKARYRKNNFNRSKITRWEQSGRTKSLEDRKKTKNVEIKQHQAKSKNSGVNHRLEIENIDFVAKPNEIDNEGWKIVETNSSGKEKTNDDIH